MDTFLINPHPEDDHERELLAQYQAEYNAWLEEQERLWNSSERWCAVGILPELLEPFLKHQ